MNAETVPGRALLHPSQRHMGEALPQIVWTAAPDGTVDWINREFERYTAITGIDPAAGDWLLAVHPDDHARTLEIWGRAVESGLPYRAEFRIWCAEDGRWRWHVVDARPHRGAEGEIRRWYGVAIDIQELRDADAARAAEMKLRTLQNRILERIAAGEPLDRILTRICGDCEALLDGAQAAIGLLSGAGRVESWHADAPPGPDCRAIAAALADAPVPPPDPDGTTAAELTEHDLSHGPIVRDAGPGTPERSHAGGWSMPVRDSAGRAVAVLAVFPRQPRSATEGERALLERISAFIGLAIGYARDRDRVRESERRYHSLFDLLPIAVWEEDISEALAMIDAARAAGVADLGAWLDADPARIDRALASVRILGVNAAALDGHGVASKDELLGTFEMLRHDPEMRASVRAHLVALHAGERFFEATRRFRGGDGKMREVLVRMLLSDAERGRLLVTELDITERRRAEQRFRMVARAASDIIFERDFTDDRISVSEGQCTRFGYPPEMTEHPRSFWIENLHPDDRDATVADADRAIASGAGVWQREYRYRRGDGTYVPVRESANILRDEAGRPVWMVGNMVDLSAQKSLEEQLRQAQRLEAIGQLTGGLAHDFNNLLAVILGNAELLLDDLPERDGNGQLVRNIIAASERGSGLIQRLLAFARKQPLKPVRCDPNEVVQELRALIRRSLTPAIELDLDLEDGIGAVEVDRAMFESALLNLCVNARDAMPDGGMLRIATRRDTAPAEGTASGEARGEHVRITVSDTGVGMEVETRNRAFEPFYTTKRVGEGSGLGLSMVYGFVRQSGGQVRIDSAPGRGSRIELCLPGAPAAKAEVMAPEPASATPAAETASARLLIVEDEDLVRDYISTLADMLGHSATAVSRAQAALDLLAAGEAFDLIVTDVVMPGGISGRQLAATVLRDHPATPVLMMSGQAAELSMPDAPPGARIGFLRKPFRKRELAERLAELLDG